MLNILLKVEYFAQSLRSYIASYLTVISYTYIYLNYMEISLTAVAID